MYEHKDTLQDVAMYERMDTLHDVAIYEHKDTLQDVAMCQKTLRALFHGIYNKASNVYSLELMEQRVRQFEHTFSAINSSERVLTALFTITSRRNSYVFA